mgnify:CR=1 FL=1
MSNLNEQINSYLEYCQYQKRLDDKYPNGGNLIPSGVIDIGYGVSRFHSFAVPTFFIGSYQKIPECVLF